MTRIQGFATADATASHGERFETVQHAVLGRTALHCSQAGFGCYRVADGVEMHRRSLQTALARGINLIDTSTNYADGESEALVGKVLSDGIQSGDFQREEIVVVSKVGYLQGRNYALSQDRKARGRPFPDIVPYAEGLEHCLHPEFILDQLDRSLERLGLATVDVYLLHNPEYYLSWAAVQGIDAATARVEYDRRILTAFRCLEAEAARGRIRYYGISSNTFPAPAYREDFTCLARVCELADRVGPENRFTVVQFPMNLVESGAVLTANQPDGTTLLDAARRAGLSVLINRPLNAIGPEGLLRLADVEQPRTPDFEVAEQALQALMSSEAAFLREILPSLAVSEDIRTRIQAQVGVSAALRERYREFPSYDAWCQMRDTHLLPRVNGVLAYLERKPMEGSHGRWSDTHRRTLAEALEAVTALYAGPAAERAEAVKGIVREADPDWHGEAPLSQLAIRALRTTSGIASVLVGMRRPEYVHDVLQELAHRKAVRPRTQAWRQVHNKLTSLGIAR